MKTLVSAHNCIFGPRHLGIYGSTMRHWRGLQKEHECFFIIDDFVGHFTHPIDESTYTEKAHFVGNQFLQSGVDPEKSSIVQISEIPEIFELAFLLGSMAGYEPLLEVYGESMMSSLTLNQRQQWGLPDETTFGEVIYPSIVISAYVIGLQADLWQGGLEITGNHSHITRLVKSYGRRFRQHNLKSPELLYGNPNAVLGADGNHMTYSNRLELQSSSEEILSQVSSIRSPDAINSWFEALGVNKPRLTSIQEINDEIRNDLYECLVSEFEKYRVSSFSNEQVIDAMTMGTDRARERISSTIKLVKSQMKIRSYLNK